MISLDLSLKVIFNFSRDIILKNKTVKNIFFNLIKTISSIFFPLITFPYISRVLQPASVGKYNWANSYVSYFTLLASLGITTYAIRECSKLRNKPKELDKTASQIYSINILSMLIAYLILLISLILFRFLDKYRSIILILSMTIFFNIIGTDWINSAFEDFGYITFRTVFFQIISLILMFLLVKDPSDYNKYALIAVISASGASLTNILYRKKFCKIKFTFSLDIKKHLPKILSLFVLILVQNIYNNSDITMIGIFKNNSEVGYYSTAVKVSGIITQVVASIAFVVMPQLSRAYSQHNYHEINLTLNRSLQFLVGLGFPMCFGIIALSKDIITILGGKEYQPAVPCLILLMIGFLFSSLGGSFIGNLILIPSSREKYFVIAFAISAGINIFLNIFLIPLGGATAAAFTTMLAEFILFLLLKPRIEKEIKILSPKIFLLPPIIGSVLLLIWCYFIKIIINQMFLQIVTSMLGSILIYVGVLILMRYPLFMELISSYIHKKGNN